METIDKQILQALRQEGKTGKYSMARIDEAGADKYYGFLSPKGYWYLMIIKSTGEVQYYNEDKKDLIVPADTLITAFIAAWTDRATLTYREYPLVQLY